MSINLKLPFSYALRGKKEDDRIERMKKDEKTRILRLPPPFNFSFYFCGRLEINGHLERLKGKKKCLEERECWRGFRGTPVEGRNPSQLLLSSSNLLFS